MNLHRLWLLITIIMKLWMRWLDYRLDKFEDKIMSVLSDYLTKQKEFNTKLAAGLADVKAATTGVSADLADIKAKLAEVLASETITGDDKILIQELGTAIDTLGADVDGTVVALKTLDAAHPPVPPVEPPAPTPTP